MSTAKEAKFHGIFYTRLLDHISEQDDIVFDEPVMEKTTESGSADIFIPSVLNGEVVIEVKNDDVYPRESDVIKQARRYSDDLDTEFFATCNSNDLFLFRYQGEIEISDVDYYYFNLREHELSEVIPQFLGVIEYVHERQRLPDQTERERIVGVLRSFHSSIWPTYKALAEQKYERNEKFTREFDEWVQENDYEGRDEDEQFEIAAKQYAYLLTNKVLFYEVLRERTQPRYDPDRDETVVDIETASGFELDALHGTTTVENLDRHLRRQFQKVIDEIDYEPIFDNGESLFADFPQNTKTLRTLEDFLRNIEAESITRLDEDLLGEIYEELIPIEERKQLGQFYTHHRIAETIAEWTVQPTNGNGAPRVLDPASGSGTFCVEAYQRLEALFPNLHHQEILDHITAVDINRFPLHLTALNLASQNITERTDRLDLHDESFFHVFPNRQALESTRMDQDGELVLGEFDAIVGNPPYIEQRDLYPDKEHFRAHLKEFGRQNARPYYDGDKKISKRSDAYVYFVTHATEFLRDGGRLGFIIPTKWMVTQYGETFQEFLYDYYKLNAVVAFGARAFDEAFVDSAIILLERCENEEERRQNTTKFMFVREQMDPEDIVDTVSLNYDVEESDELLVQNREAYRVVALKQASLMDRKTKKNRYYLTAPKPFIELLENPRMTPINDLLNEISRGVTTGANDFFIISEEDLDEWELEDRFLTPFVKWIKQMEKGVPLSEEMTNLYTIDIHEYVENVRHRDDVRGGTEEERVKDALREDGYNNLLSYIKEGEAQGYHENRTCASRKIWFDLGELARADIIHPKGFKYRVFGSRNEGVVVGDRLYTLFVKPGVDTLALLAYLNSTVYQAVVETWGRNEGRGMLEIMAYEVEQVPALDVRLLDDETVEALADAYLALEKGEDGAQDQIDSLVIELLDMEMGIEELQELTEQVTNRRNERGMSSDVMVEEVTALDELGTDTFTIGGGSEDDADDTDLSDFM